MQKKIIWNGPSINLTEKATMCRGDIVTIVGVTSDRYLVKHPFFNGSISSFKSDFIPLSFKEYLKRL